MQWQVQSTPGWRKVGQTGGSSRAVGTSGKRDLPSEDSEGRLGPDLPRTLSRKDCTSKASRVSHWEAGVLGTARLGGYAWKKQAGRVGRVRLVCPAKIPVLS